VATLALLIVERYHPKVIMVSFSSVWCIAKILHNSVVAPIQ